MTEPHDATPEPNLPQLVPEGSGAFLNAGCCVRLGRLPLMLDALSAVRGAFWVGKDFPKTGTFFPRQGVHSRARRLSCALV
jgi:hypothetical protein